MAGNGHFTSDRLACIRGEQEQLDEQEQMYLAAHLAEPCRPCWEALDRLPPADPVTAELPLARALCRVGNPGSWLAIRREHLRIVQQLRSLDLGFGFLLLEEVLLGLRERVAGPGLVRFLWCLADSLTGIDLSARYHLTMARVLLRRDNPDQAEKALSAAEHASAVAPCPVADLHLLRLDLARSRRRTRHALREMHRLRQLLPSCDPVERFEIAEGIIDRSPLVLDFSFGGEAHLTNDAAFALAQLDVSQMCADTVLRLNGLLKKTIFAQRVAYLAYLRHGAQVRALAPIAAELEAALPDFEAHADTRSLACVHHLIGCLKRVDEPLKAAEHIMSALAAWARAREFGHFAITLADLAYVHDLSVAHRKALYDRVDAMGLTRADYEKVLIFYEAFLLYQRQVRQKPSPGSADSFPLEVYPIVE